MRKAMATPKAGAADVPIRPETRCAWWVNVAAGAGRGRRRAVPAWRFAGFGPAFFAARRGAAPTVATTSSTSTGTHEAAGPGPTALLPQMDAGPTCTGEDCCALVGGRRRRLRDPAEALGGEALIHAPPNALSRATRGRTEGIRAPTGPWRGLEASASAVRQGTSARRRRSERAIARSSASNACRSSREREDSLHRDRVE